VRLEKISEKIGFSLIKFVWRPLDLVSLKLDERTPDKLNIHTRYSVLLIIKEFQRLDVTFSTLCPIFGLILVKLGVFLMKLSLFRIIK
jgi:hypothetical protein